MPLPIPEPRANGLTTSTEIPLYWCTYGEPGAPRLVVLHGGPGAHHDYLLPQMLQLATNHELYFYDQRGGGRSRTDDRTPITWRTHIEDLGRVVRESGSAPLSLVGYSWGGILALLYALEASEHAELPAPVRLVLINPAPLSRAWRTQFETEFLSRQQSSAVQTLRDELAQSGLRERDPEVYKQRAFELSVAGYFADPAASHNLTPFRVTARVQQSVWESLADFDLSGRLEGLRIPSLVLHGRRDPIPLASSEEAARALNARFLVMEASGHVPYVEQPGALFSTIEQFLQDTRSAG